MSPRPRKPCASRGAIPRSASACTSRSAPGARRGFPRSPIAQGRFAESPARAGLRYAFDPRAAEPLGARSPRSSRASASSVSRRLTVDGHTHLHLHPDHSSPRCSGRSPRAISSCCASSASREISARSRSSSARSAPPPRVRCCSSASRAADRVFGLRDTGRMTGDRLARLLRAAARRPERDLFSSRRGARRARFPALRRPCCTDRNIALTSRRYTPATAKRGVISRCVAQSTSTAFAPVRIEPRAHGADGQFRAVAIAAQMPEHRAPQPSAEQIARARWRPRAFERCPCCDMIRCFTDHGRFVSFWSSFSS